MAVPVRTCAGCGRKAPKGELARFVAVAGELRAVSGSKGHGVYTCRRRSCFERALSRRAFERALRTTVRIDPGLFDLYTDADG